MSPAVSGEPDGVDDPGHARNLVCDRFGHLLLKIRIDQTIQINDVIDGLHREQVRRL